MKNVLRSVLVGLIVSTTLCSAAMTATEKIFVPWGEGDAQLKHHSYSGLHSGPLSFQVMDEQVIIFDTENKKLKTFDPSGLVSEQSISLDHMLDFYQDNGSLYLLGMQNIYRQQGEDITLISESNDPKHMLLGLYKQNDRIRARTMNGSILCDASSFEKSTPVTISVTRSLPATVSVHFPDRILTLTVPNVGSVDYIGSTPDHQHYIYAESIIRHAPLAVARYIYRINEAGEIQARITLPAQQYTYIFKEFSVGTQGELYHMLSLKDGIHIMRWDDDASLPGTDSQYPETFGEVYHFNAFLEPEPDTELRQLAKTTDGIVTRSEALAIGDEYVTHTWTATSANIGTTATVTTPSWIVVGQNQRVPYKWGGWSTVAQFDEGIAAGKLAGDINTSAVDWGNSVGADCSGFVSVCWNTSQKYGTSTISNCSSQLSSYYDLLPGDATNKAGSHIRMVVEWAADGRLVQVEETSSGTPGWAARYYTWTLSQITDYVPIRYNNIQNINIPRPTLLSVVSKPDSVIFTWTADESSAFTGYKIYRKLLSESAYVQLASVPIGTQSITLAQTADIHGDYKVASYLNGDSNELSSDVYAMKRANTGKAILIVDGFDRYSGSYALSTHSFVAYTAKAMDRWDVAYESCANEAIISGDVDLRDYEMVWWILGDESTADETFGSVEQDSVESYLKQGGKLFVSGSELAWDLDSQGSVADKSFIHNYLKTTYAADDAGNYSVVGATGSIFAAVSLEYSDDGGEAETYTEDYPDVFSTTLGSVVALKYGNSQTAAVSFDGSVTGATAPCKVMVMGFPFETITTLSAKENLAGYILRFMGYDVSVGIVAGFPETSILYQNYPNPFNPMTTLSYSLNVSGNIRLRVYNLRGEMVGDFVQGIQSAGYHELIFNGTSLPSGVYVYRLDINNRSVDAGKMILSK